MKKFKRLLLVMGLIALIHPLASAQHFETAWQGFPYNPMQFFVSGATLNDINLESGDEIAVFDVNSCGAEICVGVYQLSEPIIGDDDYVQFPVSQNDADAGEPQNGFIEGNEIIYRFWDNSEEKEIAMIDATYYVDPPTWMDTFNANGSASVSLAGSFSAFSIIESAGACNANSVTIPVKVFAFDEVTSIELEIDYDDSKLIDFEHANINPSFTGLTATASDGTITINWDGASASANNENLLDLIFTTDGSGSTCLNWNSENSSVNGGALDLELADGDVFISESPEISGVTTSDVTCNGEENGSISIVASGSSSQLFYSVDGGDNFQAAFAFNDLPAGSYDLVVQDDLGCETIYSANPIIINEPDAIVISDLDTEGPECYNGTDGFIDITAQGGSGDLQYSIDNGNTWSNTGSFSDLAAGSYDVLIKDENECILSYENNPVVLSNPDELIINEVILTDVEGCFGEETGSIEVNAQGGTGSLLYSFDNQETWTEDAAITGLPAGSYQLFIKDANDCMLEYENNPIIIDEPDELTITEVEINNATAYNANDGSIIITASGGTGQLEYSIDEGSSWQTENNFETLFAGTYNIIVKDQNDCSLAYENNPVTITQPNQVVIDEVLVSDVTGCFGNANGSIEIMVSQGEAPYQYSIDNGESWQSVSLFEDLTAGNYNIQVKDNNDYLVTYESNPVTLIQPQELVISEVTQANIEGCYGDMTGEIAITASGGTGDIQYSIDDGSTWHDGSTFSDLGAGDYQVWVKDGNDCMMEYDNNPVTLTQPEELVINDVIPTNIESCYGDMTGEIAITASGGTGDIQYSVDEGNTWYPESEITGLAAGDYNVWVKDANECMTEYVNNPVTLTQPDELVIDGVTQTNIEGCYGDMEGSIEITASGGTGDIQYSIDEGVTWHPGGTFSELGGGDYQVWVKDANECMIEYENNPVTITQPDEVLISEIDAQDASEFEADDGSITIIAEGGTGELLYSIDDGATWQAGNTFEPLVPGEYYVAVKDENDCINNYEDNPIIIEEPPQLAIDEVVYENVNGCYDNANGSITIFATGGGSTILYSIDDGDSWHENDGEFEDLDVGEYNVKVKNEDDIIVEYENNPVVLTQPEELIIETVVTTDLICYEGGTGEISITASGGTGDIQYSIDDGDTWQESSGFENLMAGEYTVLVKDANDCVTPYTDNPVTLIQPDEIEVDVEATSVSCYNSENGMIDITATGGTGEFQYSIDDGITWMDEPLFTDLEPGDYYVMVKDGNECLQPYDDNPVEIEQPDQIVVDVEVTEITCYGADNAVIEIIASGGTGDLQYTVGDGWQSNPVFTDLEPGAYTVMVQDENGCMVPYSGNSVFIENPELLIISEVTTTNPTCSDSDNGTIEISSTGGTGDHQYSIDGGETWQDSETFDMLGEGEYEVVVSDENDCYTDYDENPVTITAPPELELTDVTIENISCFGSEDGLIDLTATGGTGELQYSIDNGESWHESGLFEGLSDGTYQAAVKDENDCMLFWEDNPITIEEPDELLIDDVEVDNITCNEGSDGSIIIIAQGGTGVLEYSIDGGSSYQVDSEFSELEAGEYDIAVRDENNCQTVYSNNPVVLTEPEPLEVDITADPDVEVCANQTITLTATASQEAEFAWEPSGQSGSDIEVDSTGIGFGSQEYTVTAINEAGCEAYESITITFLNCTDINDPDNDLSITIHPNPAKGKFGLTVEGDISGFDIRIYDALGHLVHDELNQKKSGISYHKAFDFSNRPDGVYYLKINSKEVNYSKKLIISK